MWGKTGGNSEYMTRIAAFCLIILYTGKVLPVYFVREKYGWFCIFYSQAGILRGVVEANGTALLGWRGVRITGKEKMDTLR